MRVLVTGATGFVGSQVTRLLVRDGCEVCAVIREHSSLWRISDIVSHLQLVRADLKDVERLDAHLQKFRPDLCIHLAWHATPGQYLTAPENLDLMHASLRLASCLAAVGCKRLVGIGTCFEYDTDLGYLSEDSATAPRTLYAACKLALQSILAQLARITGMEVAWCRLFYVYGPFEDARRLVPSVVGSLLQHKVARVTSGTQLRDYLHVEDVAAAIWAVARHHLVGPVNIGSGRPVAVRELVEMIGSILGRQELIAFGALPHADGDPLFVCANNRRLVDATGWGPRYDLPGGLRQTVEWWQSHLTAGAYPQ